jgi:hypothetical protein
MAMAALHCAAQAQAPAAAPQAQPSPAPLAYAPAGEPMNFRMASGAGPRGAARWISATGQIQAGTPALFAEFVKKAAQSGDSLAGMTLALDSTGGRVSAAMAIGRAIRAAGLNTTVGRTVSVEGADAFRTNEVGCSSACVLMLMGGKERIVADDARVNVHMFSVELDADGNKARSDASFRDVEQAQRTMARHAVYVAEMGVEARYLEIMTEASFRGAMRRMTRQEIAAVKLASVEAPQPASAALIGAWALSQPGAPPQLIRGALLSQTERLTLNHELILECDLVRGFFNVTYRQQLARLEGPRGPPPVALNSARLDTGGWDFVMRAPPRGLAIATAGNDLWMRRSVPRKVFEDAAANGKLTVEIAAPGRAARSASLYDPSLGRLLPELARRCDARPGLVTVGPHPRR